jgi:hypothetical protein
MAIGILSAFMTKIIHFVERQDLNQIKKVGRAKTRLKLQVFELDDKSMIEEKKRKYGRSYYISPLS